MVSYPQVSPQEPCAHLAPPPYAPHAPHISFFSILPPAQYWVMKYRSLSSSLCNFLHYPVTSSLLRPNTPLNTLFSNTLSLRSSLNVSDQASHPYRTMVFNIYVYLFIYLYLYTVIYIYLFNIVHMVGAIN